MHVVTSDGARVAYRLMGAGTRSLVLLHGWAMSGAVFDELVTILETHQTRVLVIDQRGAGASSRPEAGYTLERSTDDAFLQKELLRAKVADRIGGARLCHLPGAGHYPQVERKRETAAIVEAFLAGLG